MHTVTSGATPDDPQNAKLFDTSMIMQGKSAQIKTASLAPGDHPFHCTGTSIHERNTYHYWLENIKSFYFFVLYSNYLPATTLGYTIVFNLHLKNYFNFYLRYIPFVHSLENALLINY